MKKIGAFLGRRVVKSILVLLAIALFNFFLVRAAPGDPAEILAGQSGAADAQFIEQLRKDFGLDKPMVVQLGEYLKNVATFDLGYSYRQQTSVSALIMEHLPATLALTLTAFAFAVLAGVSLGTQAALRVGKWGDTAITVLSMLAYATPLFWVGLMLVLIFSVHLEWLPAFGFETVGANLTGLARFFDIAKHLLLPALTLGMFYMAVYTRLTRASILEVSQLDFVKTARAKGLSERTVITRHVLRNALLPVITYAGIQAGGLIGGALLVETVFAWPGIGRLAFDALLQRDYSILLGVFFVASLIVVIVNLVTDILYTVADPRIELK
ncbi:ABC transporter permease [Bordetella genomosp. 5]|uniref:ABC transporter permease n=1 Tax=Bordetella genomosp. 5 TaxID=1395608 RepID=A0A261U0A1_9BORD|nr:ABC transporter permease [Bordetella genomosp. 5]OZI33716.1 ABC transporter permease [Bordetella genomosp. 5]OZI55055.1 ABC transporter permease [Bordetella genomosp. 5]